MNDHSLTRQVLFFLTLFVTQIFFSGNANAQKVLANTSDGQMIELNVSATECSAGSMFRITYQGVPQYAFSSCLQKDTLYYVTNSPWIGIGRYVLSSGGDPVFFAAGVMVTNYNSMAISPDGIIYLASPVSRAFASYNTRTGQFRTLGSLPFDPSGDLMFYKGHLLLAAIGSIVEVNIENPALSTIWMPTPGYSFFGMISTPLNCRENRYYGIGPGAQGTALVELDLENKVIGQEKCTVPYSIWDGASAVDGGATQGAGISEIQVNGVCAGQTINPSIQVKALSASLGSLSYILDGNRSNNTGVFDQVSTGTHTIRVQTENGCVTDTAITVSVSNPVLSYTSTLPTACNLADGLINASGNSPYPPFSYRIGNQNWQAGQQFSNLGLGTHRVEMRDKSGCTAAADISLQSIVIKQLIKSIQVTPSVCRAKNGHIVIEFTGNTNGIVASLNGGAFGTNFNFTNLDTGQYKISLKDNLNCILDTLINVGIITDPSPEITSRVEPQSCFEANGRIVLQVSGNNAPYLVKLGAQGTFSNRLDYSQLSPGDYIVTVQSPNLCEWQQTIPVAPYPYARGEVFATTKPADCDSPSGGEIRLNINGPRGPYQVSRDGQTWLPAGEWITGLVAGSYLFSIRNADGCLEKTGFEAIVEQSMTGNCDFFYVPTAFTPNGDGLNETLEPRVSPLFTAVEWSVYNRLGQRIFSWKPGQTGWDGTFKSKPQPAGTFVWKGVYKDLSGKPVTKNGIVQLIR